MKCGCSKFYLIDFHHINPAEKDYAISENSHAKFDTLMKEIQKCVTTNAVLDILYENDLLNKTMDVLNGRIGHNIDRRIPDDINVGFICFANTGEYSGVLFESENADSLKELWKN